MKRGGHARYASRAYSAASRLTASARRAASDSASVSPDASKTYPSEREPPPRPNGLPAAAAPLHHPQRVRAPSRAPSRRIASRRRRRGRRAPTDPTLSESASTVSICIFSFSCTRGIAAVDRLPPSSSPRFAPSPPPPPPANARAASRARTTASRLVLGVIRSVVRSVVQSVVQSARSVRRLLLRLRGGSSERRRGGGRGERSGSRPRPGFRPAEILSRFSRLVQTLVKRLLSGSAHASPRHRARFLRRATFRRRLRLRVHLQFQTTRRRSCRAFARGCVFCRGGSTREPRRRATRRARRRRSSLNPRRRRLTLVHFPKALVVLAAFRHRADRRLLGAFHHLTHAERLASRPLASFDAIRR